MKCRKNHHFETLFSLFMKNMNYLLLYWSTRIPRDWGWQGNENGFNKEERWAVVLETRGKAFSLHLIKLAYFLSKVLWWYQHLRACAREQGGISTQTGWTHPVGINCWHSVPLFRSSSIQAAAALEWTQQQTFPFITLNFSSSALCIMGNKITTFSEQQLDDYQVNTHFFCLLYFFHSDNVCVFILLLYS